MIDLEVMAKKPDGAIAAIAAVPFDIVSGVTDDALFYEVVDLRSSAGLGGSIDADAVLGIATVTWLITLLNGEIHHGAVQG